MKNIMAMMFLSLVSVNSWADDFKALESILGTEAKVKITLGPGVLGMARMFTKDDQEAQAVLSGLKDLSINVYELNDAVDVDDIGDWMSDKVRSLAKHGVEEIIKVVEGDERVHIMAKVDGMILSDLSIMVFEAGDEFVYIKLDGEIDVAHLKDLTANFDVDVDVLETISLNL
ncbi:DUF4252 domain-containing protein [Marinicella litoralis]|uniref:Uncharacterized protein DUF4252 n=1 Tax=Marinicella litoralis TaxID=644220 RepID=A0A4R6XXP8_9GAMM|nr:DUF4252 domain-containing protein [Marinicella litoralis]TDR22463.1 uncharacterized protein DUF4252 [Marinicella litoralis]